MGAGRNEPARPVGRGRPEDPADRPRRFPAVLGWTVLGALLPGLALVVAGRRRVGGAVLAVFLLLVGAAAWVATGGRRAALRAAVDTDTLLWIAAAAGVLALAWATVVVVGYRLLAPPGTPRRLHVLGGAVVALLVLAVAAPALQVGRVVEAQRQLIAGVFEEGGDSATVVERPDPFGDKERVNVLLLGGDGGEGREGVRTDTVIVASVDTDTGDTTLISLPRNLQDLPFPETSPLAEVYPDGFEGADEADSLLNAVYRTGPAWYPEILGETDDPGADFLKLGVGEATGLTIDYYVLVNLEGFSRLVDALGGITVNVNYFVPINGDQGRGILPDDYIEPGPNQHLDGFTALQFARGRFGLTDYDRMARQRCTIDAIIDAADPVTLLRRYQDLAATTEDIVSTDVPRSALDDFVDLAFLVKEAEVRSLVLDDGVIDPAYPDYDEIRRLVDVALRPPTPAAGSSRGAQVGASSTAPSAPATAPEPPASPAPAPSATPSGPVDDVTDACAYDPARAAEARAAGEPPSRNG